MLGAPTLDEQGGRRPLGRRPVGVSKSSLCFFALVRREYAITYITFFRVLQERADLQ